MIVVYFPLLAGSASRAEKKDEPLLNQVLFSLQ